MSAAFAGLRARRTFISRRASIPYRPWSRRPRPWWSRPVRIDARSMFARTSRHTPAARGIRRPPRIRATAQNGKSRQVPASLGISSGRRTELSSGLLIRGFGVQVPGGAPVLTWGFTASGNFLCPFCPDFRAVLAPCLLRTGCGPAPLALPLRHGRSLTPGGRPAVRVLCRATDALCHASLP